MVSAEQLWARYLPGPVASAGSVVMIVTAPRTRQVTVTLLATLLGLVCMEAEYWVASGFPTSEVPFFVGAVGLTLAAYAIGRFGTMILGLVGLFFFAYVNLRYGAPYLLDYVMPVLYGLLIAWSRRALHWNGPRVLEAGKPETIGVIALQILAVWRTTSLGKWGWIAGGHWH
ncbi:MAG TPA: hypothetical protein VEV41_11995 [Terriglobales bacterium]|nr:hypothetical protein [Terriglobales bacterium]